MKHLILLCAFLALSLQGSTQTAHEFSYEIGPNVSTMFGNEILEMYNNPLMGYTNGVGYQYNFNHLYGIKTGIFFEQKGNQYTYPNMNYNGLLVSNLNVKSRLSYLTFPLLGRISFGNKWRFFFNAGGYGGVFLKMTSIHRSEDDIIDTKSTSKDYFKRMDFGLSGGFGVYHYFKNLIGISAEVRSNYGLYNISDKPVVNDGTIQNFNTNLVFSIRYSLMKKTQQNP